MDVHIEAAIYSLITGVHRRPCGKTDQIAAPLWTAEILGSFETYCGNTPESQLYQVMHCTNQPPSCKPQPDRRLGVDRNGLESGSEELWLMGPDNCSVRFSGKPGAWRVEEAACQSSE